MEYSVWTWRWTNESWEPVAIVSGLLLRRLSRGGAGMRHQSHEAVVAAGGGKGITLTPSPTPPTNPRGAPPDLSADCARGHRQWPGETRDRLGIRLGMRLRRDGL